VLGLHFFATCSAVNASTSPPRHPQQCPNLFHRKVGPATRNSLPSGRWKHRTKNCTALKPAGRCFCNRSRQRQANDWKPVRKPVHGHATHGSSPYAPTIEINELGIIPARDFDHGKRSCRHRVGTEYGESRGAAAPKKSGEGRPGESAISQSGLLRRRKASHRPPQSRITHEARRH
jgi:hypothetical protein